MAVPTTSEPEFEEVSVIDHDFHFLYGGTQSFTLFDGDTTTPDDRAGTIIVRLKKGPIHTIYIDKLAFHSEFSRMHRIAVQKAPPKVQQPLVPSE